MTHFWKYGLIAGDRLLPLEGLLSTASLTDESERINVLKIDCEGCEWDAFDDLVRTNPRLLSRVDQIVLELHLRVQFMLTSVRQLERLMRHLLIDHGFRVLWADPVAGFKGTLSHSQAPRDLEEAGWQTQKYVAVEMSLMRPTAGGSV